MVHRFRGQTLLTVFLTLLFLAPSLFAQSKEERAVRALIDRLVAAHNSIDPAIVRQVMAEHGPAAGPFFPPFAPRVDSVAELETQALQLLSILGSRSFATTSPVTVHVDRKNAWSSFTWHAELTFKDGTRRTYEGRSTWVFAQDGKNWKLKHWHSSLPATPPLTAAALKTTEESILAGERAAWEARKSGQTSALENYFAENASYFDDSQAYRVRGKQEVLRGWAGLATETRLRSWHMLDPRVQVLGDTALLTYYFTESGIAAGKEFNKAGKISVIFVRENGSWRALHYHRSVNP
jgi:ketosteroid isomerase-like protein